MRRGADDLTEPWGIAGRPSATKGNASNGAGSWSLLAIALPQPNGTDYGRRGPFSNRLPRRKRFFFAQCPTIGHTACGSPEFLVFNGHRIDLPDESVERIVCSGAFHHIPNQEVVLRECYRLLKPGGIAGFSEPGRNHSQSPQSQQEMSNFNVLENDIVLEDVWDICADIGFSNIKISPVVLLTWNISIDDFKAMLRKDSAERTLDAILLLILFQKASVGLNPLDQLQGFLAS